MNHVQTYNKRWPNECLRGPGQCRSGVTNYFDRRSTFRIKRRIINNLFIYHTIRKECSYLTLQCDTEGCEIVIIVTE